MALSPESVTYSPTESRAGSLRAVEITTYVIAVVAVALRFWSRHLRKVSFWLDDWLVLSSLAPALGFFINVLVGIPKGLGRHHVFYGPQVFYNFNRFLFISEIHYTVVLVLVKYGILALYWRIFTHSSMKISVICTASVITAWGVAVIVTTCLQCVPTRGFWDKSIESSCQVDTNKFFIGVTIVNILTDGWLLILPIPFVLSLQSSISQKAGITGMFLLGGFVTFASILRLVSVVNDDPNDPDVTWSFSTVGMWSAAELNIAIVSANLPCLGPIYSFLLKGAITSAVNSVREISTRRHRTTEELELQRTAASSDSNRHLNNSMHFPRGKGMSSRYMTLDDDNSGTVHVENHP